MLMWYAKPCESERAWCFVVDKQEGKPDAMF